MITYALAPNPKWYFLDAQAVPASGGSLTTWFATDHSTPKFVFSDPGGMFPYIDPIIFDATGGTPVPMYWETTSPGLYYIVVKDSSGNIIFDLNHFPIIGGGGVTPITSFIDIENHIINGAFLFIDADNSDDSVLTPIPLDIPNRMAPAAGLFKDAVGNYVPTLGASSSGWIFSAKGGAGETSTIRFVEVTNIGEGTPNAPSANATRFFRYNLSAAGAPQTERVLYQTIPDVETFSNETLTISLDVHASTPGIGTIEVLQFYGTGGAPSAPTSITQNFTFAVGTWLPRISVLIAVPSVMGKSKGTNGDDCVQIRINFPLNVLGSFDITTVQLQRGNFAAPAYIYQDYNQDQYKVLIDLAQLGNAIFTTGTLRWMSGTNGANPFPISGWLPLENIASTIGSNTSSATFGGIQFKNLYVLWWNSFSNVECIVSGGRGASAVDDFNNDKRMTFPTVIIGTVMAGAGAGLVSNQPFGAYLPQSFASGAVPNVPTLYLWLYVKL